jgi:hypothetical protein
VSDQTPDIRVLHAQATRVETGPVQFGDDWPGVFIRGDNAFGYVGALDAVLRKVDDPMAQILVQSLRDVLTGCDLTGLSRRASESADTERHGSDKAVLSPDTRAYIASLVAENSDLRQDAERYRWLREQMLAADFDWQGECVLVFKWPRNVGVGGNCDMNIDAARLSAKEPT